MINFKNDYCGIGAKEVLEAYNKYSCESFTGYSTDYMCDIAREKIKDFFNLKHSKVEFTVGGTSTNKIVIAHSLKPYEAVICATTGHINTHETGAIEETGHKVYSIPSVNGKLSSRDIEASVLEHSDCHMVHLKMVYISYSTEYGTLYTLEEIKEIRKVCDKYNLYLFLDGARLGAGLASKANELDPKEFENLFDVFYVGGTKNGLPLGEAVCICNKELQENILYSIKHYGGMLAKGFLYGIGFSTLFTDNLFLKIAKKENELANKLEIGLENLGFKMLFNSPTNQIFPIVPNSLLKELDKHFYYEIWTKGESESVIRFVTSYLTTEDDINNALRIVATLV